MIGDVVGFAAATYLRGVGLVHVPTTLLAQVDSSIGGKVGINHALGKNLIGSFHQPLAVFADPEVLGTLPRREFRAGLYEVVKYGMIADSGLFERVGRDLRAIVRREQEALAAVIADSCRIKARVVSEDERESGLRRILNFGHTAGHAIEAVTKYRRFRHGEAVAYGMLAVADLGVRRGVFAEAERSALADLVARLGPLPAVSDLSAQALVEATRRDATRRSVRAGCTWCCRPGSARPGSSTTSPTTSSRNRCGPSAPSHSPKIIACGSDFRPTGPAQESAPFLRRRLLGQRLVHQIRDPLRDGERCRQSERVDSRGLHESGLPPVAPDQEVREGLLGEGAAGADAAAAGAKLMRLEVGQQPPGGGVEPGDRLAVRFVVVLARLVAGGGSQRHAAPRGAGQVHAEAWPLGSGSG